MSKDKSLCVYCGSGWRRPKDRVKNNQLQYQKYLKNKALRATFPSASSIWSPPSPQLWLTMPHQTLIFTLDTSWLLFLLNIFPDICPNQSFPGKDIQLLDYKGCLRSPRKVIYTSNCGFIQWPASSGLHILLLWPDLAQSTQKPTNKIMFSSLRFWWSSFRVCGSLYSVTIS